MDIWSAVRPGFGIVDGIIAMEGDGPIMGPQAHGCNFYGRQFARCRCPRCPNDGLIPERIPYLATSSLYGGTIIMAYWD